MVPALMVMLLTMICGFLPALNVVGEKEAGTIEQINVTPVRKFTFIAAKLIPYWLIGLVVLTICFVLAWLLYGILPAGHFLTIYGMALVFLPVVSGFGLVISNHSATLQQAMFVMWFFMLILILMSGLFTPIHSMPECAMDYPHQSAALFCGGDAYHLSPWRRICRTVSAVGSLVGLCIGLQSVGGTSL